VLRDREVRMFSRTGEDVGPAFPDLLETLQGEATLDGELLVGEALKPRGFADLQQRLNRKTVDRALMQRYPAFVRVYDILFEGSEDLRPL
ncbi:ATP-dependent DNA ligase, partial [Acinetobacter baumannii]